MKKIFGIAFSDKTPEERIRIATTGLSISRYANSEVKRLPPDRLRKVEQMANEVFAEFNLREKPETV